MVELFAYCHGQNLLFTKRKFGIVINLSVGCLEKTIFREDAQNVNNDEL